MARNKNKYAVDLARVSTLQDVSNSIREDVMSVVDDTSEMQSLAMSVGYQLSRLDDIIGVLLEGRKLP